MVPYMHKGDAMPISEAGMIPRSPRSLPCMAANMECIFSLPKTEIREPRIIPKTQ